MLLYLLLKYDDSSVCLTVSGTVEANKVLIAFAARCNFCRHSVAKKTLQL